MTSPKFHLGWFLGAGFGVQSWNQPWSGTGAQDWMLPDQYVDLAHSLERACFDFLIMEDSVQVSDTYKGSMEYYLRTASAAPKHDPAVLAAILAHETKHLGIIPTLTTTFYHPYTVARMMTTLDHIARGRIGWNVVTGSNTRAAQNYGFDMPEHDVRYEMADEFVELAHKLWDSWEDDAVLADVENGVYADHEKVHRLDFQGKHYASRGPLNTVPSPQKSPVILQAGGSSAGKAFAARWAEAIISNPHGTANMRAYREEIRTLAAEQGRDPDHVKVLYLISPVFGETTAEAKAKMQRRKDAQARNIDGLLAGRSHLSGIDLSKYDLDAPLPADLESNGHRSSFAEFKGDGTQTLRERLIAHSAIDTIEFIGTPEDVADQMEGVMQEVGGDGFLIAGAPLNRRYVAEVTDGLAPVLKRRGLTRDRYEFAHFRDNLRAF
ncbi:NtaA/DmoA family FMN-dependent monooxygenase [Kineococcus rhizosphaerae]|uniref:FMN-dependent oxidoreductase (Nitrilotriacetate monooxygenase family) n=1 Tax=Kineococcus rhizosphaerae TaxID=559628 RepID=A0A2T0QYB4_9ACTN|nr:NtaA/DmoA family FMN-dependent monooxygenase [Kineococcus rhizosphaerae]PRY11193.1 FMN-dependent oxidoreductase (nitrilotriacetate monooxygenase family) [Kineococcus rhizosphaerae]